MGAAALVLAAGMVVGSTTTITATITTTEGEGGLEGWKVEEGGRLCIWRRVGEEEGVIRVFMEQGARFRRGVCRGWGSRWVG